MHNLELIIILVHPDGWVHNFRIFAAFLTLLFVVDDGDDDGGGEGSVELSVEFLEDDAVTEVDGTTEVVSAAKTMALSPRRSSEEEGVLPLLLTLPLSFVMAYVVAKYNLCRPTWFFENFFVW